MNGHGHRECYDIKYHYLVVESAEYKLRIKKGIEEKLTAAPNLFGKPLRKSLKGYRTLRVGDYRIVFKIRGATVFVLLIEHRSIVYEEIFKRGDGSFAIV